jgi:hypothetical protein
MGDPRREHAVRPTRTARPCSGMGSAPRGGGDAADADVEISTSRQTTGGGGRDVIGGREDAATTALDSSTAILPAGALSGVVLPGHRRHGVRSPAITSGSLTERRYELRGAVDRVEV